MFLQSLLYIELNVQIFPDDCSNQILKTFIELEGKKLLYN